MICKKVILDRGNQVALLDILGGRNPGIIIIGICLCENSFWIPGKPGMTTKNIFKC